MREEGTIYQLIEDYLNGDLTGETLAYFEKELLGNPDLQHKVKLQKMANELVVENRLLQVKEILQEQQLSGGQSYWRFLLGGMAGLLLLTGAFYLKNKDKEKPAYLKEKITAVRSEKPEASSRESQSSEQNKVQVPEVPGEIRSGEFIAGDLKNNTSNKADVDSGKYAPLEKTILGNIPEENKEQTIKAEEKQTVKTERQEDPCHSSSITADITTNPACAGEEDGSILVAGVKGGSAPYSVSILDARNESQGSPLRLPAGTYRVLIKDHKGCQKYADNVIVAQKACNKDYSFNPFVGESWNIPVGKTNGKLFVYNNSGKLYFEKEIVAGTQEEWSGESQSGEMNVGYYIFVVKYQDETQVQGSVTIIR